MQINGNTLTLDDGRTIALPKYPTTSRVKVWRVPAEYRADGVFISITGPGLAAEDIPACNLADCTVIGELDYPADDGAALEAARAQRLELARASVEVARRLSLADTPVLEQQTWSTQLAEAQALAAWRATPEALPAEVAPLLTALAAARAQGETVFALADKVLAAASRHVAAAAPLVGAWQRIERQLRQADTLEALLAVDLRFPEPQA